MTEPAPRGRPSVYEPWMCDKIIEVAKNGGHQAQMCIEIGINSRDTLYRWRKEHQEFGEAYDEAMLHSLAFHENLALRGAAGLIPGFNVTALAMTMNNKFPNDYSRGSNGANVNPSTTINLVNLTPDEIRYKIAQKTELLRQKGQLIELQAEDAEFTDA